MKKILLATSLILSTLTTHAEEIEKTENASNSFYINTGTGMAWVNNWNQFSQAFNINLGYNFNQTWATEVGYTYILPQTNYTNGIYYTANQSFTDIAGKASIQISPVAILYAKAGLALGYSSSTKNVPNTTYANGQTNTNLAIYSGLGISFILPKSFKINTETTGITPFSNSAYGSVSILNINAEYSW